MPLEVLDGDFASTRARWDAILPNCWTNTVYVTQPWQTVWWRFFGESSELHVLEVRDGDSTVGIAPIQLKEGVLSLVGYRDLFDYNDFLVVKGREHEFYPAMWAHLSGMEWSELELRSVPEASPTMQHVPSLAAADGLALKIQEEDKAPIMELPSTWDDYVAGLGKKKRHELRRKIRRVEEVGELEREVLKERRDVVSRMPDFFRLMRASAPEKERFLTERRESFFAAAADELAAQGSFRLSFLNLEDRPVAANVVIEYGDAYLLYNSGYDPDYSHLAVGLVNTAFTIKDAIENGRSRFEFLRGTERYKYDLGAEDRSVHVITVRR